MRWTSQQLIDYELRQKAAKAVPFTDEAVEDESQLHRDIIEHCKNKGWRCIHSRMDKRTTNEKGTCDFVIAADRGRTFYVEAKRKGGKLSFDQQIFITWLEKLGHKPAVVDSMASFLEAVQ